MVEIVGGALVMLGGGALSSSALILHRAQRRLPELAAELHDAFPARETPEDMAALLERMP